MEKCKKLSLGIMILILLGCIFIGKSYAEIMCRVNLTTANNNVTQGEEISVYARISNLQTARGIITIGATLDYDKNNLTLINIEGENGWSPMHNSANGKIAIVRNGFATADENVIKMTFKVSESAETSTWVRLNDFQIADGDEERNIGGATMEISINPKEQPENPSNPTNPTEPETPANPSNPTNQGGNSSNNNKRPSTGSNKPSTNNNNTPNNETLNNETNTNEGNETNVNENVENKNTINFGINENFSFEDEEVDENAQKNAAKMKRITYGICIGGIVVATAIMFLIIKSSGKEE